VPSVSRRIADGVCIKDGNIFLVAEPDGGVPVGDGHGYSLYYHNCLYLNGYQFQIADAQPIVQALQSDPALQVNIR
jgi:5-deoxy-D-glucuronate isomerase